MERTLRGRRRSTQFVFGEHAHVGRISLRQRIGLRALLATAAVVVWGCSDDGDKNPIDGGDVTPPAQVTSLLVVNTTISSATLQWTAPGDDGLTGTTESYDLRYSLAALSEATWAGASQATSEPDPGAAGTLETCTVTGLADTTVYYFALRALDEAANTSELSNVVPCTTRASAPPILNLSGYWSIRMIPDSDPDPADLGDCISIGQTGGILAVTSQCFDGEMTGTLVGDSVHLEYQPESITLIGEATNSTIQGTWTAGAGGAEGSGSWAAQRMSSTPDAFDCVVVNADVLCGHTPADAYVIVAQIDDHAHIVEGATLTGDGLTGSVPLSDDIFIEEEDEWWTDPADPGLVISSGVEPTYPLHYTIHIDFTAGPPRDVTFAVMRSHEIGLPDCEWHTVLEDDFSTTVLAAHWDLYEGEPSLYVLNGEDLAVDDAEAYSDGPYFMYTGSLTTDRVRFTCAVRTAEISGEVEMAVALGDTAASGLYVFGLWEGLRLIRDKDGEELLAHDPDFVMAANQTLVLVCESTEGHLRFTVKTPGGDVLATLSATDPQPLSTVHALFGGEIDDSEGEYLYFDDVKLEECR